MKPLFIVPIDPDYSDEININLIVLYMTGPIMFCTGRVI